MSKDAETERLIDGMIYRATELVMLYRDESDWQVRWTTGGCRYVAVGATLRAALLAVLDEAARPAEEGART